jgi:hypothetical protein
LHSTSPNGLKKHPKTRWNTRKSAEKETKNPKTSKIKAKTIQPNVTNKQKNKKTKKNWNYPKISESTLQAIHQLP